MRTAANIESLLPELEHCIADDLEDQDLDFKQWDTQSRDKAVRTVVQMAVCMANGGGGTVVFGVADRSQGRESAILGVPPEIDINLLKKAVYDQTDPKITPVFEELAVPEGTGRLLLMQIYPGMPPYTDSAGRGTIRVGKDCQPLTGTLRRKIGVETGETDYTGEAVSPVDNQLLSATALESLRNQARKERAPDDLLRLSDVDLLSTLGLVKQGKLTRAAILLAGTEAAIREHLPGHNWTFLQMTSDTDYGIREDRVSALPLSIQRIEELLVPFNPITTYKQGMFHYEYRTWPEIAVREALMNAFCHVDLRIAGPVMVKLYSNRLEISNNGGFIAGITPNNILHHQPAARNPLLVEALEDRKLSVGAPYFDRIALPLGVMLVALMGVGPALPWGEMDPRRALHRFAGPVVGGIVAALVVALAGFTGPQTLLALFVCGFALVANLGEYITPVQARMRVREESLPTAARKAFVAGRRRFGGHVAHLGIIVLVFALALSKGYRSDYNLTLRAGQPVEVGQYELTFTGEFQESDDHRRTEGANILVRSGERELGTYTPVMNFYRSQPMQPHPHPAVRSSPAEDLYLSLGQIAPDKSWASVRVSMVPAVWWLWMCLPVFMLSSLLILWPGKTRKTAAELMAEAA